MDCYLNRTKDVERDECRKSSSIDFTSVKYCQVAIEVIEIVNKNGQNIM